MIAALSRNDDGTLPAYAWPGGYPIFYVTADNGVLCPTCANGHNGSESTRPDLDPTCPDDRQWIVAATDVHWEGPPLVCEHCGASIESAYGDPDEPDSDEPDEPDEPEESDLVSSDGENWYQDGRLVLTIGPDEDRNEALRAFMDEEQFWPNAWSISDHGNAHLIDLNDNPK